MVSVIPHLMSVFQELVCCEVQGVVTDLHFQSVCLSTPQYSPVDHGMSGIIDLKTLG